MQRLPTLLSALLALLLPLAAAASEPSPEEPAEQSLSLPARIDELDIDGLWRTRRSTVLRELPWKPGEEVTQEAWELGLTRLWNIGVFSRVSGRVVERDGKHVARLDLEERLTVNLHLKFGQGGGTGWLQLGLYDVSLLGDLTEAGFFYERFGHFNGGQAWLKWPRFLEERQELLVQAEQLVRPRPGFSNRRTAARSEYTRQLDERLYVGGRLELSRDELILPPFEDGHARPRGSDRALAGARVRLGRMDTVRLLQTGWTLDLRPALALTTDPDHAIAGQATGELLAFWILGDRVNLALRSQVGASTPQAVHNQFFLGGLDMVRGYDDSTLRTELFAMANVELRVLVFDSRLLALMPAVFLDGAIARDDETGRARSLQSVGGGIRFLFPFLHRSGLRVDFAASLPELPRSFDRVISVGGFQFF